MADNKSPLQAANLLNFFKGELVKAPLNNNLFIGLSTTLPTIDGSNFTEPASSTGYTKVPYPTGVSYWTEPVNRVCTNQQPVFFPDSITQFPTVVAIGIFDETSDTVPIYFGHIDLGKSLNIGDGHYFPPGKIIIQEVKPTFTKSDYLANAQLKLLRNETFETPSEIYLALGTMAPTMTGDIGELTVSKSPGYTRIPIPCNSANWQVTGRNVKNLMQLVFPAAQNADWESIKSFALHRTATGNTTLLYCGVFGDNETKVINSLDILRIPVGAISVWE
jgi:hypothetical protein